MTSEIAVRQKNWAQKLIERDDFTERAMAVLHSQFSPDSFRAVIIQALMSNPDLQECQPASILHAALQCARLGIEPLGQREGGWLIPRREKGILKAVFQISYDGLIRVIAGAVDLIDVRSEVVRKSDRFRYIPTSPEPLEHEIDPSVDPKERGDIMGAWAMIRQAQGPHVGCYSQFLRIEEIEKRRRMGFAGSPAWKNHFEAMARKTALASAFKLAPKKMNHGSSGLYGVDEGSDEEHAFEAQASVETERMTPVEQYVHEVETENGS